MSGCPGCAAAVLAARVFDEWGIKQATAPKLAVLHKGIPDTLPVTTHQRRKVYWPVGEDPSAWHWYRVPTDDPRTKRTFAQIPFEAIAEQQTKTGGYGAEFGRSLGGVVNQITKRGTNEFKAGANVFWAPKSLRSDVDNVKYSNPLEASDFGTVAEDNSKDTRDELIGSVWAGGALVQDRLFGYALLSYGQTDSDTWGDRNAFTNRSGTLKNPTWLAKFDWNINDSNKLELTAFSDKQETETKVYANTPGEVDRTAYAGTLFDT